MIILVDDDYDAMVILMNVVHLRGDLVPRDISLQQLNDLAVLSDKYDTVIALGIWPEVWSRRHLRHIGEPGMERLLFIALMFQFRDATGERGSASITGG